MNKSDAERMRNLLMEAVTTLCRSGIRFDEALRVEGLLAITVDESDIIVVNVNKTYENPNAAAKKNAAKAAEETAQVSHVSENESETEQISDGGTKHKRRRRKKRHSENGDQSKVPSDDEEAQTDNAESVDTPTKRLKGDNNSEAGWSVTENSQDSQPPDVHAEAQVSMFEGQEYSQTDSYQSQDLPGYSGDHGRDTSHAIKIEIDSDSETEDKEQITAQLFGNQGSDQSLIAVPLDQSQLNDSMTVPVSMYAAGMPGTSAINFPGASSSQLSYPEMSPSSFTSPQQRGQNRQHQHDPSKRHICSICNKCFQNKRNLDRHCATVHMSQPTLYMCPCCHRSYNRQDNLMSHIRNKHGQPQAAHTADDSQQETLEAAEDGHLQFLQTSKISPVLDTKD